MLRTLLMALAAAAMLSAAPALAGGPFYNTLYDATCTSLSGKERVGCHGYLQYRIQRGKSRVEASNKCHWGCGELFSSPSDVEQCRTGCNKTNAQDR